MLPYGICTIVGIVDFKIRQEKFEGPLDTLVELIEKEQLSISQISLARIADEYIAYIKLLAAHDKEELAEFLVIAAHLLLLKSRALLPKMAYPPEEERSLHELEQRLKEYKKFRALGTLLRALESKKKMIVTRELWAGRARIFYPSPSLAPADIGKAYARLIASFPKEEVLAEEKIRRIISLEEKMNHIKAFLNEVLERTFSEITRGTREKNEIIVSFLALLELTRQKFLDIRQENPFEDIVVKRI